MAILKKARIVPLILGSTLILGGCGNGKMPPVEENMVVEQAVAATPVEVLKVTESTIENKYMYSGTVQPINEVSVLSTVNGTVSGVNYDVGDQVAQGTVLFTMDTTDIQNNIKIAQASLATAEAGINTAKTNLQYVNGAAMQSQIASAKTGVENAKISYSNAEISYQTAQNDYNTYKALYEAGGIAKTAFEQYEIAYQKAELALKQAEVALNSAKESYEIIAVKTPAENLKKAQDALASAEASKKSVVAQLESYQKALKDATVKSPISGIVSQCNVKKDTVLSQGASVPFVIIDLSSVNIEVNVAEQLIPYITVGDEVEVLVSTVSTEKIKGDISTISPIANADGTYTVKIKMSNADGKLKAGMFGEVYFAKEKSQNTIVLPRQAVMNKEGIYYVFVEKDGLAIKTEVQVGIDNGDVIEVTSGLSVGMNVITKGQSYLVDGDAVNIVSNQVTEDDVIIDAPTVGNEKTTTVDVVQSKEA